MRTQGLRPKSPAPAIEARRKNTRVIEYNEIIGAEQVGKLTEVAVFKMPGRGGKMKKPGSGAIGKGLLCYQFFRKIVMEIRNQHAGLIIRI